MKVDALLSKQLNIADFKPFRREISSQAFNIIICYKSKPLEISA